MYKAAIFDLDGTLLDTLDDLWNSVNVALDKNGMPRRRRSEVRAFLGNGMRRLIHLSVPAQTDKTLETRVYLDFREHYAHHDAERTTPYPQIKKLLEILSGEGVLRGVVSNKGDSAVQDLVASYFPGLLNIAVGEREDVRRKPAPDTVLKVMGLSCSLSVRGTKKFLTMTSSPSDLAVIALSRLTTADMS